MRKKKRILVAPLNWGLGHASRCIPLIRCLYQLGVEPIIAAEGSALFLLKEEFPTAHFVSFTSPEIRYPKNLAFWLYFTLKFPHFQRIKREEYKLTEALVQQYQIDGIISDNRYGVYHAAVPSVIITHQLFIPSPVFKKNIQRFVHRQISKFDFCWIPDWEEKPGLSGKLSHGKHSLKDVRFIGPLSRFHREVAVPIKRKIIVVLSGPEPHRSKLEEQLLKQLLEVKVPAMIIRGVEGAIPQELKKRGGEDIQWKGLLSSKELAQEIKCSELVICRSGYSSVMDLLALQKEAILIPTPGQGEQEYLAQHLRDQQLFYTVSEKHLKLSRDIPGAKSMERRFSYADNSFDQEVVAAWLRAI
jgi:UDP:flavonoid glycosyltransferase YjiC (YdhE family)